ncbi:MAG: glycosyltransferase family 4 protein [Candidatus Sulfotelmatobacter sp.]|jgi:D-inositol-3-phosphate glycosyltransferase
MNRTIYLDLDEVPSNPEQSKGGEQAGPTVWGSNVYNSGAFNALLKYSTFDTLMFPAMPWLFDQTVKESPIYRENAHRIRLLQQYEMPGELAKQQHLVFASLGPLVSELDRLRRRVGRQDAPATGVIHSNNHAFALHFLLLGLIGDLRPYDSIICSSQASRQTVLNLYQMLEQRMADLGLTGFHLMAPKTPLIPIGIEASSFVVGERSSARQELGIESGVVLLYFGRFCPGSKADPFPLLVGFHEILEKHPDTWLVFAGDDSRHGLASDLLALAASLGIEARVRIIPDPSSERKRQLYAAADIFVSLADNLQESFGITLLEAMAAGLPVIASDWDGYKDTVIPGKTGILVHTLLPQFPPPFDPIRGIDVLSPDLLACSTVVDLQDFAQAVDTLIVNPELRASMGEKGRRRVHTHYDWKVVIESYEQLWNASVEEGREYLSYHDNQRLGLTRYDYRQLFADYPTTLIASETRVRLTSMGQRTEQSSILFERLTPDATWFQKCQFTRIFEYLNSHPVAAVGRIAAALSSSGSDCPFLLSHVSRLWKYGLIEAVPQV